MSTITVGSGAALTSALKSAQSGDIIQLQPGVYSDLVIKYLSFGGGVTITSADPNNQAIITNFTMNAVEGLTFSGVELAAKGVASGFGFNIMRSKEITFDDVYVHGSLDNNAGNDTGGLMFQDSSNITITNSEFTQLRQAVGVINGKDLVIEDNHAHHLMKTGFVVAGVSDVRIAHNTISDIKAVGGEHPDAIQFFTTGTKASASNITVTDNVIVRGDGDFTQGIFFRDQVGTLPYLNVSITNNLVVGTGYGGVYVAGVRGLTISGNELVSIPGKINATWMRVELSDDVRVSNNEALAITYDKVTRLTESGNTLNQVVSDGGAAAIRQWAASNPDIGSLLADHVTTALRLAPSFGTAPAPAPSSPPPPVASGSQPSVVQLGDTARDLTLTKSYQVEGVGNALDNAIIGTFAANKLVGLAGNDTLSGLGGKDTLVGGLGDDTYIVPDSASHIIELSGQGNDTVIAKGNFVLGANVENLVINSTVANGWSGTGNELHNRLTGNAGDNRLDGGGGNDTIVGGAGKDVIVGGAGSDRLTGGVGADTFSFAVGSGRDVVTDFGLGREHDVLDFAAHLQAGLKATLTDTGADVLISWTNGDTVTILGRELVDLEATATGWIF